MSQGVDERGVLPGADFRSSGSSGVWDKHVRMHRNSSWWICRLGLASHSLPSLERSCLARFPKTV
ncbi:hypothetical protein B0O99DRAFT_618144 [Bisporella sp. PMI_857]|nr:hypothetical protein B0O99DRAFT_618144 [Bisporella sp. PMI_857]